MSGDHHDDRGHGDVDRDGVPLPTAPPAELAEVYPLHPPTGDRGLDPSDQAGRAGRWWRTWAILDLAVSVAAGRPCARPNLPGADHRRSIFDFADGLCCEKLALNACPVS